jgi:Protein of unknown function (DUF4012)
VSRHRVDERVAVAIAGIAGLVAVAAGASPTGSTGVDAVIVAAAVGAVVWAGATAPWWAVVWCSGIAAALAGSIVWSVVGVAAVGAGLWIGAQRRDLPAARGAVVAVAANVMIRSQLDITFGVTAAIGLVTFVAVATLGLRRRSGRIQRWAVWSLSAIGALAFVATASVAAAGYLARHDLIAASRSAREALALVEVGDYEGAATLFADAADGFARADDALSAPWAQAARLVPVVAQHRAVATDLAASGASATGAVGDALTVVDPDQLRLVAGRLDLDAVRLIAGPFLEVQTQLGDLAATIDDVGSPWLVGPVQDRLDELGGELADVGPGIDNAVDALEVAPRMLGADEPRHYFIAFTTPAETRGLGGFMGNWAELTATDGKLEITDFGRTVDLNRGPSVDAVRRIDGPSDWLDTWGRFGFDSGPDGATQPEPWSNVTMSPQFPSTAEVIASLYPASGGRQVDGVFAMDPYVLQSLLRMTGPISLLGSDVTLDASNVVQFLLVDQYEIAVEQDRVDVLQDVSAATLGKVLGGALPSPPIVAHELSPLVDQGRLTGWAVDDDEFEFLSALGMTAALPPLEGGDGVAVVLNNAGANKLDVYMQRSLTYRSTVDERTGDATSTATVTLTNTAPTSGLPDGVIGNYTGEAAGTNRVLVSMYSALPLTSASATYTATDTQLSMDRRSEAGWNVNSAFVAVPAGSSVTLTYEFEGALDLSDGYRLATRPQPIVIDEQHDLTVTGTDGRTLVRAAGPVTEPVIHTPN